MTLSIVYTVNGYDFECVCNAKHGQGIVVDRENTHFEILEYVEALQHLCGCFPYINAMETLEDWASMSEDFTTTRDEYIAKVIELWNLGSVEENTFLDPSDNVRSYVEAAIEERERRKGLEIKRKAKNLQDSMKHAGYVYLLQSSSKNYKIGRTKNPKDRIRTFSVKLPFEVEYIAVIQTTDMYGLERQLHERFVD